MKRKITTILLATLLVVATAIGLCACANQEDIDNALLPVEQQVTLINTTLDEMKATDKTLNDSITALTGRVSTLEGELETAQNNIGNISTALEKEIADRKADIKTLQDQDTALQAQITALETALTNKEQGIKDWANGAFVTVTDWTAFKNEINTTIEGLTSRIETLESSVGKINATLTEMKATDTSLKGSIDGLTTKVTALETELVEVNAKITSLQTDSATKEQLETVKTALQKQIDDLNDEIDELKAKDTELQNQIADLRDSLTGEIKNVKDWANSMFISSENWNMEKAQIERDITALYNTVGAIEDTLEMMNTTITALQEQIDQNKQDIKNLQDLVDHLKNCINGKHETDTYTWADDFSSCTASGHCKYCGAELNETTTNISDDGFNRTATFESPLFKSQTIDLTDLTWMSSSMYENALNIIFSKGETNITLNLPKDYSCFISLSNAIDTKSSVNVNLTLKGVEKIDDKAFNTCSKLYSIYLPDVIEFGEYAFSSCSNLVSISAEKVQKIGNNAVNNCTNITELSFPEVTEIGEYAFNRCAKLSKISLPKLTKVSFSAFSRCENLKQINLPLVTELDRQAFMWSYLESITFGSQITEVGNDAFSDLDNSCIITFAKGQMDFKVNDEKTKYVISENEVEAGENKTFCGKTFKEIIIAEE